MTYSSKKSQSTTRTTKKQMRSIQLPSVRTVSTIKNKQTKKEHKKLLLKKYKLIQTSKMEQLNEV